MEKEEIYILMIHLDNGEVLTIHSDKYDIDHIFESDDICVILKKEYKRHSFT